MWQIQYRNEAGQWIAGDGGAAGADEATFNYEDVARDVLRQLCATWSEGSEESADRIAARFRVVEVDR